MDSIVASTFRCGRKIPGSNPGPSTSAGGLVVKFVVAIDEPRVRFPAGAEKKSTRLRRPRFYGVAVSTQDSESCDPGSNPGRTYATRSVVRLYSSVGRACASYIEYEFPGHSLAPVSHKRKVRGSIPRGGCVPFEVRSRGARSYSVVVITPDFDSGDPGSNPGRTCSSSSAG